MIEEKKILNYRVLGKEMFQHLKKFVSNEKKKNPKAHIIQMCGPISTGGLGNTIENIKIFQDRITKLRDAGYPVFDQTPFEEELFAIKQRRFENGLWQEYDYEILEQIYRPIFKSRILDSLIFTPDYRTSVGACWEYSVGIRYKLGILHWEFFDNNLIISLPNTINHIVEDLNYFNIDKSHLIGIRAHVGEINCLQLIHDQSRLNIYFEGELVQIALATHPAYMEKIKKILEMRLSRIYLIKTV